MKDTRLSHIVRLLLAGLLLVSGAHQTQAQQGNKKTSDLAEPGCDRFKNLSNGVGPPSFDDGRPPCQ